MHVPFAGDENDPEQNTSPADDNPTEPAAKRQQITSHSPPQVTSYTMTSCSLLILKSLYLTSIPSLITMNQILYLCFSSPPLLDTSVIESGRATFHTADDTLFFPF